MNFSSLFKFETETVSFSAGDPILKYGEKSEVMFVLIEGEAEIRLGEQVIYTAQAGDLLGELGLIDDSPVSADVTAKTDCRLARIDKHRFLFLVQQTPNFALDVMKVIAERLRAMNSHEMQAR